MHKIPWKGLTFCTNDIQLSLRIIFVEKKETPNKLTMAAQVAKELIACSICEISPKDAQNVLYTCVMDGCSKYGDVFCLECGKIAHKRKDHTFDIQQDYIKRVDMNQLMVMQKTITVKYLVYRSL